MDTVEARRAPAPVRAARGARLMDERVPGWHELVDPRTLDIRSGSRCVIAQVFNGSFTHGLLVIDGGANHDLQAYGFNDRYVRGISDHAELEAAWEAEINTRRYGTAHPGLWTRLRIGARRLLQKAN